MEIKVLVLVLTVCCVSGGVVGDLIEPASNDHIVKYNCEGALATGQISVTITLNAPSTVNKYAISKTETYDLKAAGGQVGENADCHQGLTDFIPSANAVHVTLTGCPLANPVYVYLLRKTTDNVLIYGGKDYHVYKIDCNLDGEVAYQIHGSFTDVDKMAPAVQPQLSLAMTITPTTGAGAIHVGDVLTVKVEETSAPKHFLRFDDCKADDEGTQNIILISDGVPQETDIIETVPAVGGSAGTVQLTMTAFRFSGASNSNVKLTCNMVACTTAGSCSVKTGTVFKRSLRNETTHTVQATYTLTAKEMTSGQNKAVISAATVAILLVLSKLL